MMVVERRDRMNQVRIGKFIAECRKQKGLTQADLGGKLGVTEKSVSNWENGRNMPDLSLFKPLCDELDITINDLMSGEKITQENYQERLEENIVNTINYSTKNLAKYSKLMNLLLMIFGLFISLSAVMIFPSESSWGSIYSVFGILIFIVAVFRNINVGKWYQRFLLSFAIFTSAMGVLLFTDYIHVKRNEEAPMFRLKTTITGNVIYYDTLFYDVYRCNFDEKNEYWVISKNKKPTISELIDYCKE